jgi:hypothetical protein
MEQTEKGDAPSTINPTLKEMKAEATTFKPQGALSTWGHGGNVATAAQSHTFSS